MPSEIGEIRGEWLRGIFGEERPMGVDPSGRPNIYPRGSTAYDIHKTIGSVPEDLDSDVLKQGRGKRVAQVAAGAAVGALGLGYGAYRYLKGRQEEEPRTDMAPVEPDIPRFDPTGNPEVDQAVSRQLDSIRERYGRLVEDKYDEMLGPHPDFFQSEYDAWKEWTQTTDPADMPPVSERGAQARRMFAQIQTADRKWSMIPSSMTEEDGVARVLAMARAEADAEIAGDIQDLEMWRERQAAQPPPVQDQPAAAA